METSTTVRSAVYRRHNGTNWEKIYFETSANLVHETDSAWFLKPSNTVNGIPFTKTGGIILTGEEIKWKKGTPTTVFSIKDKIEAIDITTSALNDRIANIEGAYTGGDIITVTNMGTKITAVATITSGVWHGTAIADAYIASASKWNNYEQTKQNKLTFDNEPTANSANPVTSKGIKTYVDNKISTVTAVAQGKTNTYVIDASQTASSGQNINHSFNVIKTDDTHKTITILKLASSQYITDVSGNIIELKDIKVGDIILTTGDGIKDWFLGTKTKPSAATPGSTSEEYVFYQIDSDTPDLTVYALNSSLGTAASKAVSTSGPSANGANLVTEAQVKSFVEGKGYITSYKDTTYTFAEGTTNGAFTVTPSGGSAQSVKVHGLAAAAYKGVDTAAFATSSTSANLPTTAAVAGTIANRATKVAIQQAEPTGLQTGDIWIELTN